MENIICIKFKISLHGLSVLFNLSPVYKIDISIFPTLEYTLVDEKCLQKCELCQLNHPENEVTIPIQISSQLDLFTFPYQKSSGLQMFALLRQTFQIVTKHSIFLLA